MILIRTKNFSKEEENKKRDRNIGIASLGVGAIAGKNLYDHSDELTGRVVRYHNTKTENVDNILKEGIKSKFSTDPNNITNKVLRDVPMDKKEGLVYLAHNRGLANGVGTQRYLIDHKKINFFGVDPKDYFEAKFSPEHKTLKAVFDYDDYKNNFEKVDNPELRGAKTDEELKKLARGNKSQYQALKELRDDTDVIKGDIKSKYIKGSKDFERGSLKKLGKYIKNNPGRFAKGAGKAALTAGALGFGIKKLTDANKKSDKK